MKGRTTLNLFIIIFLLSISTAFGAVDVTYSATNVQNFEIFAYDCIDSSCNTDGSVSVEFPDGLTTTDGDIRIRYPDSLATPYGYGVFLVSDGYVPKEVKATWHTFDQGGLATAEQSFAFNQKDECSATIDDFSITNDVTANIPLVIRSQASLDATTHSPFDRNDNGIEPIPIHFLNNHYGFDVNVHLDIFDSNSGSLVQSFPAREFSADLGNPLIVGESQDVEFTWIPVVAGEYAAQMRTEVVDNQCLSSLDQVTSKPEFTVLSAQPADMCFAQLNGLRVDNPNPRAGELVTGYFDITANHADGFGQLTPIGSDVIVQVDGPSTTPYLDDFSLVANSGPGPQTVQFQFTAQEDGQHVIFAEGFVDDPICNGLTTIDDEVSLDLDVDEEPLFDIEFIVRNATSQAVSGATVTVDGGSLGAPVTLTSDAQGLALIGNLDPAVYTYVVSNPGFALVTGTVEVTNFDRTLFIFLQEDHLGPSWFAIPDVTLPLNAQQRAVVDLDNFIIEGNVDAEFLGFSGFASSGLLAEIDPVSPHTLRLTSLGVLGTQSATINVFDSTGAQDTVKIDVDVVDSNSAPTLEGLPDFSLQEGQQILDAVLLDLFADDDETNDRDLLFTLKDNSNPAILVEVDNNHFVDIKPGPNVNGQTTVTIEVTDEDGLTDVDSFTVTVGAVNTPPTLINVDDITALSQGFAFDFDLTLLAVDEDDSAFNLTWDVVSGDSNILLSTVDNVNKILTLTGVSLGTTTLAFTVTDTGGLSDSKTIDVTVVDSGLPACFDGVDNDNDSLVDFPADPGCADFLDNDESDVVSVCSDGLDNDLDGLVDFPLDPGCTDANDNDEFDSKLVITNVDVTIGSLLFDSIPENSLLVGGQAGDDMYVDVEVFNSYLTDVTIEDVLIAVTVSGNGYFDSENTNSFDLDFGVTDEESLLFNLPQTLAAGVYDVNIVADGIDELTGLLDHVDTFNFQISITDANGTGGNGTNTTAQCADGLDNDLDGLVDFPLDPGCTDALDNDETDVVVPPPPAPQCSDGLDNDGDGLIDFPADFGCTNAADNNEADGVGDFRVKETSIDLEVEEIRIPNAYDLSPGDLLVSYLKFENNGNVDLENLKVIVMIDELGLRRSLGPKDLEGGERRSETLVLDLPYDTPPGYYPVRYTLVNGDTKRSLFREIWVN